MTQFFRTTKGLQVIICLLLAGAVLLPYIQVKDFDYITFDDNMYVYENPQVLNGLTWTGVKWAFTTQHAGNWHPLTWLSHMLDSQIFGAWAGGPHLTNLLFHLASTLLLFLFWARVTQALWPSALVAALFALHPLHVESVAWVSERKDVLSAFFWIATMWAYAGYAASPSAWRYLAVILLFALGLMAKPMLVTLPFVLLLLDYWPLGRIRGLTPAADLGRGTTPTAGPARQGFGRLIFEKIPLFALAFLSCLITLSAQRGGGSVLSLVSWPLAQRFANALVTYVKYVVKMFWPPPLAMYYPLAPVPWWQAAAAGLVLLAVTTLVLARARRSPYLAVGWLWYLGTMVPVIGLVQVGGQAMADRYTYIPFIGLFLMVAWGIFELTASWRRQKIILAVGAAVTLAACWWATWVQVGYWRNSETLFTHTIRVTGPNYIAYHHLGTDMVNRGHLDQAIALYRKTLAIAPSYAPAYNNLGCVYARQGNFAEAVPYLKQAIRLAPHNLKYYRNLAQAYTDQGKKTAAAAVREHIRWLQSSQGR
ncbi:MAG: tetratricopeptide repeat protein [Syntrophobacterales bacterium]|jgi:hypothetical protein